MPLSRSEVRNLDRRAIDEFQIPGLLLMENAGINITAAILSYLSELAKDPRPIIVCGRGNNGGDGLVVARHLHLAGIQSVVAYIDPKDEGPGTEDARVNFNIVQALALPLIPIKNPEQLVELFNEGSTLLCDAFLGTGIHSELRPFAQSIVNGMNRWTESILAIDIPSGLDCDRGVPLGAAVRAHRTVTMAAMKQGFLKSGAAMFTGIVEVVPIGAPPSLLPPDSPRVPKHWERS